MDREMIIRSMNHKKRADISRFSALVRAPQTLAGGVAPGASATLAMPGNGYLAVSSDAPVAVGDIGVGIAGRVVRTQALSAGQIHKIGYVEAGKSVHLQKDNAGAATLSLYIVDEFGTPKLIATSSFT